MFNSFATPSPVAHQAPLSKGSSRQEYWSGLPFSFPGDLPDPGVKSTSPALAGGFFTRKPSRKCKMQIKMTMKYHFTSTKIALVKSQTFLCVFMCNTFICVNKVAQEVGQSFIPSENSFLITLKNSLVFTKLLNTYLPYDPQFHSYV